jgi:bifunctional DNA-binding transcriptional regulator/antitoxin component of YhaV-PrlF toxin-antitoxin module
MLETVIAESSVTQKYQATIPLQVREQLGIQAGDKLSSSDKLTQRSSFARRALQRLTGIICKP